jgi:hypothetical protein
LLGGGLSPRRRVLIFLISEARSAFPIRKRRKQMSISSMTTFARAAALAALVVVPASIAFAADNATTQQSPAPQVRQQAQAFGTTAAAPITNGRDVNGDDPYVTAFRHEKFDAGRQAPTVFSNEPNWNSPEYVAH